MSQNPPPRQSRFGLETAGLRNVGAVHWNLTPPALYEMAIDRAEAEGHLALIDYRLERVPCWQPLT